MSYLNDTIRLFSECGRWSVGRQKEVAYFVACYGHYLWRVVVCKLLMLFNVYTSRRGRLNTRLRVRSPLQRPSTLRERRSLPPPVVAAAHPSSARSLARRRL